MIEFQVKKVKYHDITISRLLAVIFCFIWLPATLAAPQLDRDSIKDVIAAMTLKEKVAMVTGTGLNFPGLPPDMQGPAEGQISERVPGAAGSTYAIPRLGIPSIVLADGPAGLRIQPLRETEPDSSYYCTAFPIATALASSWDTELVERVGRAMGNEDRAYGVDVQLAPALNLHRVPLGGRNFEYYSEDPVLSGNMAAAMVRGIQSQGVGTAIKHYVANNEEWNRYVIDTDIDTRTLREIYLKGFEIAVKQGKPWSVMSSYNKVNGQYTSESPWLLTTVLRDQWGFTGLVMTDWWAGRDAAAQMQAGNDLLMPGTAHQQQALLEAVRTGKLDESVLDRNIANILKLILRTQSFKHYRYSNKPDLTGHATTARTAAAAGMVLLKNTGNTLPLAAATRLALFGNSSYETITGGTGSGDVNKAYSISIDKGLTDAGYTVDNKLADSYSGYIKQEKAKQPAQPRFRLPSLILERDVPAAEIKQIAAITDVAIITLGRISGESVDRKADNDFYLSDVEKKLISNVAHAYHAIGKKVIVILNIGGVIETASWRDQVDGILLAWQPGQEAGYAIADVVTGKVNPSGRLPDTFPLQLDDVPSMSNFPGVVTQAGDPENQSFMAGARAAQVKYNYEIWVGYRYFHTRNVATAYPFGFGLSYTDFNYSNLKFSSKKFADTMTVSVTVTNTGKVAGRDVVQLYLTAPQDKLQKPVSELKAFGKTRLLQPGEKQKLTFKLTARDLASFDADSSTWLADAGTYTLSVGASSTDIRLKKQFKKSKPSHIDP